MDDDRDVFLPPKKFRYKTLHRTLQEPAVTDFVAEQRSRLPFKKTALTAYRTATATTAEEIVSVPTPVSPPAQMSPASACSGASMEPTPLKLPFCPYCQLPFNILVSTAPMHHLAECGQMDRSRQPECPDTVHCQSSVAAHYARYSHLALARLRAYHTAAAAASHSLLTVPGAGGGGPPPPQVHRDVQHLRQEAGFYPAPRPPAAASLPSAHFSASASNLQLLREARQQPALATAVPGAAAGRVTHSPHGSLHSPLSVSLGSPHPSPASPQAPSPLPATVATPSVTLGRCSPSSELLPMRSRANTMSPPRGGRRYGCRPRSGSFNLPPRPRSSASLSLPPRRAGFSIAEIMEPTAAATGGDGGALDLSVRRRKQPADAELLQEDRQDSVSECVSDVAERYLEEDSKQSSRTAHDSGISEIHRAADPAAAPQRPSTDSCSGGSKMTISGESLRSQGAAISQPPKKRRLAAVSSSPEEPARQAAITGYFPPVASAPGAGAGAGDPRGGGGGREPPPPPTTAADERTLGKADAERPATTVKAECSTEDTKQQWAKIMSKMRPSAVTPAQHQRAQTNGAPPSGDRKCPFYKLIPGAPFAVDAFNYGPVSGVEAYFLSHFHYDHYRGLTKAFPKTVYCGRVTGNLVLSRLKVPADRVKMLPMNEPRRVFNVEVTLLDANHCPGAVMFLFKLADGRAFLHVGDFRADPSMESYPELWNTAIDRLYLDTTYCDPVYDFPSQSDILHQCVRIVNEAIQKNPKTLIVCGSYTIGKERVFLTVAEALDCLFWASADKRRTLQCLEERQIKRRLTTDQRLARIHVLPLGHLTMKTLQNYLKIFQSQYTHIVAIKPTGWEHGKDAEKHGDFKPKVSGNIAIYGVPYSEHSSYSELRRFVQFVQPREIIPTVNVGSAASRGLMEAQFRQWLSEAPLRPRLTPPLPPPPPPPPVGSTAGPSGGIVQKDKAASETRREVKVTTC